MPYSSAPRSMMPSMRAWPSKSVVPFSGMAPDGYWVAQNGDVHVVSAAPVAPTPMAGELDYRRRLPVAGAT